MLYDALRFCDQPKSMHEFGDQTARPSEHLLAHQDLGSSRSRQDDQVDLLLQRKKTQRRRSKTLSFAVQVHLSLSYMGLYRCTTARMARMAWARFSCARSALGMAPQQCGPHVGEHRQSFADGIGDLPDSDREDLLEEHGDLLSLKESSSWGPNLDHLEARRFFSAFASSGCSSDPNISSNPPDDVSKVTRDSLEPNPNTTSMVRTVQVTGFITITTNYGNLPVLNI